MVSDENPLNLFYVADYNFPTRIELFIHTSEAFFFSEL
jgi:hypothetical protein